MQRTLLLSKIHRAIVTQRDLNYVGSITIDQKLMDASGMKEFERVEIFNISNGNRFSTYILAGEAGSGIIGINGAAARLVSIGDKIIIVNYAQMTETEMADHKPTIVIVEDDKNFHYIKK
jgi:aspartate 1-decarboxylase